MFKKNSSCILKQTKKQKRNVHYGCRPSSFSSMTQSLGMGLFRTPFSVLDAPNNSMFVIKQRDYTPKRPSAPWRRFVNQQHDIANSQILVFCVPPLSGGGGIWMFRCPTLLRQCSACGLFKHSVLPWTSKGR